ncbi:MAG: efflux RND transporter periplasmic adaptor subunit [Phycisphaerae bacterium]
MNSAQRKIITMLWGGLLAAVVLARVGSVWATLSDPAIIHLTKAQEKSLNIQTIKLSTATLRPVIKLYGTLRGDPDGVWLLSSPLAGVVANMPGKPWPQIGSVVIRGSSLAEIKPVVSTTLQITLALELTKVRADLVAAKVAQVTSAAAYGREKTLYAQNKAVSLQRVQAAQAAFAGARSRVQADEQSIAAISQQLKTRAGGVLPLPVFQSGMITDILAHPGQAVAADQPLLKIEDFHTLLAAVALPASDSGNVAMGTIIRIRALGHRHWLKAKPLALAPQADRQTRGLSVLYVIDNPGSLRPGMAITAMVPKTGKTVTRIIIPRAAVIWWRGERWVFIARGGGMFSLHELIDPQGVPTGYAVKNDSLPAQRIVSQGAQLLLTIKLSSTLKKSG